MWQHLFTKVTWTVDVIAWEKGLNRCTQYIPREKRSGVPLMIRAEKPRGVWTKAGNVGVRLNPIHLSYTRYISLETTLCSGVDEKTKELEQGVFHPMNCCCSNILLALLWSSQRKDPRAWSPLMGGRGRGTSWACPRKYLLVKTRMPTRRAHDSI